MIEMRADNDLLRRGPRQCTDHVAKAIMFGLLQAKASILAARLLEVRLHLMLTVNIFRWNRIQPSKNHISPHKIELQTLRGERRRQQENNKQAHHAETVCILNCYSAICREGGDR